MRRETRCLLKFLVQCVMFLCALQVAKHYVDQLRYDILTFRPCDAGICALYKDNRSGETFWVPLPEPPSRDIIPGQAF